MAIWIILKNRVGGSRTTSTNYTEKRAECLQELLSAAYTSFCSRSNPPHRAWVGLCVSSISAIDLMWSPDCVPISISSVHTSRQTDRSIFQFPASSRWLLPSTSCSFAAWECHVDAYEGTERMSRFPKSPCPMYLF